MKQGSRDETKRGSGNGHLVLACSLLTTSMLLLVSCSSMGGKGIIAGEPVGESATAPAVAGGQPTGFPGTAPGPVDPAGLLFAELARRGIDPARETSAAPAGDSNRVFDLNALVGEAHPQGSNPYQVVMLLWTEQLTGDYDQNGVVNAADLTPLGQHYLSIVDYDDPAQHNGWEHWPSGDPDGEGTSNWRLARVDGNHDRLIELGDITPIAQHWGERLDGYRVYRKGPEDEEYLALTLPGEPEELVLVARGADHAPVVSGQPVRYSFTDIDCPLGEVSYLVRPLWAAGDALGPESLEAAATLNIPPVAQLEWMSFDDKPDDIEFIATGSYDPDGEIVLCEWDLDGDGTFEQETGNSLFANHHYNAAGTYTAALRVTDDAGAKATVTSMVVVSNNIQARFAVAFNDELRPLDATFDPNGCNATYGVAYLQWDFDGDGSWDATSGPVPQEYKYEEPGTYHPVLRLWDNLGRSVTYSREVLAPDTMFVELTAWLDRGLAPLGVTLVADIYGSTGERWIEWDPEGDGEFTPKSSSPTNTRYLVYWESGEYQARVRVTDSTGAVAQGAVTVFVFDKPQASLRRLTLPEKSILPGPLAVFLDAGQSTASGCQIVQYEFDFESDGTWDVVSEESLVEHFFGEGTHTVKLRVTDANGFSDTDQISFSVYLKTGVYLDCSILSDTDSLTYDIHVSVVKNESAEFVSARLLTGDGTIVDLGDITETTYTHTYAPGDFEVIAQVMDSAGSVDDARMDIKVSARPDVLLLRNDGGIYDANYDAILSDLDDLFIGCTEVDYYPGVPVDLTPSAYGPVVWYRGGPGADSEPQVYTTPWTTQEIDDYLQLLRNGHDLLLMSQSHGINDNAYGHPSGGWEGYFGWQMLPGSIPDGEARHPWAVGASIAPGCASTGTFGFLKLSPRNLLATTLRGAWTGSTLFEPSDHFNAAEKSYSAGSSGDVARYLALPANRQVCGIGCSPWMQSNYIADDFCLGVITDPKFEDSTEMAFLSWGCRYTAPYENVGFWPPPYNWDEKGSASLWIIGYPWAETVCVDSLSGEMTRADMLLNILAWLERAPD